MLFITDRPLFFVGKNGGKCGKSGIIQRDPARADTQIVLALALVVVLGPKNMVAWPDLCNVDGARKIRNIRYIVDNQLLNP